VFGREKGELTGRCGKLSTEELHKLCSSTGITIKQNIITHKTQKHKNKLLSKEMDYGRQSARISEMEKLEIKQLRKCNLLKLLHKK
jgi:hypothetical protein